MSSLTTSFIFFALFTICGIFTLCQALEKDSISKNYIPLHLKGNHEILSNITDSDLRSLKVSQNETMTKPISNFMYSFYNGNRIKDEFINKDSIKANNMSVKILNVSVTDLFMKNKEKQAANKTQLQNADSVKDFLSNLFTHGNKMIHNSINDSTVNSFEPKDEAIEIFLKSTDNTGKDASILESVSSREKGARQFQFVFHPYLPYGKEVAPDEKISIHDVLPVKMVKFIKNMVEEAPWEAMFMKMVRMVVDQFVDKIIEKMFASKDEEDDKWRSADGPFTPTLSLSPSHTNIERLRRSAEKKFSKKSNRIGNDLVDESKMYETMAESDDRAWLDLFLDYVFPGEDKTDDNSKDKLELKSRKKRNNVLSHPVEISKPPSSEFSKIMNSIDLQSKLRTALKDFLRYRILKRILKPLESWRDVTDIKRVSLNTYPAHSMDMQPSKTPYRTFAPFLYSSKSPGYNSIYRNRRKRTVRDTRDETSTLWSSRSSKRSSSFVEGDETKRLWQSNNEIKPANNKRDDCSLRRACNAGRLLARLPSVQDITLQLRSHHHEPHWDALLWGMKKKKCSKLFCSRQRSPKGSKKSWNVQEKRQGRKSFSATHKLKSELFHDDMTTIIPI